MDVAVHYLEKLLEQLAEKTGQLRDHKGFAAMSEAIGDISHKYLYESHLKITSAKEEGLDVVSAQGTKLDKLAEFLGFKNFQAFQRKVDTPVDPVLLSCVGTYYCYVRRNTTDGFLLQSPAKVYEKDDQIYMTIRGPKWSYEGVVTLQLGCLFILMNSSGGKQLHHVYRIGAREKPNVLQGIFSGVSTVFDPIGGRVILTRVDANYEELKNKEIPILEYLNSKDEHERVIGTYFNDFTLNNLRINRVTTFGFDDLNG